MKHSTRVLRWPSAPCTRLRPEFTADQQQDARVRARDARGRRYSSDRPRWAWLTSGITAARPSPEGGMMNHSTCAERRPWRARPRPARTLAAVIAAVMAALLAAACSGSPSSTGSGGAPNARGSVNSSSLVGYSHCMRSHGVPNYPDPGGGNTLPDGLPKVGPQQLGVSPSQLQGAQQACQHLLPTGGSLQQQESQSPMPVFPRPRRVRPTSCTS